MQSNIIHWAPNLHALPGSTSHSRRTSNQFSRGPSQNVSRTGSRRQSFAGVQLSKFASNLSQVDSRRQSSEGLLKGHGAPSSGHGAPSSGDGAGLSFIDTFTAKLQDVGQMASQEVLRLENVILQLQSEKDGLLRDLALAKGVMQPRPNSSQGHQHKHGQGGDGSRSTTKFAAPVLRKGESGPLGMIDAGNRLKVTIDSEAGVLVEKARSLNSRSSDPNHDTKRRDILRNARKQLGWGHTTGSHHSSRYYSNNAIPENDASPAASVTASVTDIVNHRLGSKEKSRHSAPGASPANSHTFEQFSNATLIVPSAAREIDNESDLETLSALGSDDPSDSLPYGVKGQTPEISKDAVPVYASELSNISHSEKPLQASKSLPPSLSAFKKELCFGPDRTVNRRVSLEVPIDFQLPGNTSGRSSQNSQHEPTEYSSGSTDDDDDVKFDLLPEWITRLLEPPIVSKNVSVRKSLRVSKSVMDPRSLRRSSHDDALLYQLQRMEIEDPMSRVDIMMSPYMLPPDSAACIVWELLSFLLIGYDFVMLPLQIFDYEDTQIILFLDWFARTFWAISIPFCFFVGYMMKDGKVELRPARVRRNYLTTWFAFDLTVVFSDWAEVILKTLEFLGAMRLMKTLRISRIFRVLWIVRTVRLPRMLEKSIILMGIAKISLLFTCVGHLVACTWYGIGRYGPQNSGEGWVHFYGYMEKGLYYRYTTSLHWALTQFIGSMEIHPNNPVERTFANLMLMSSFMISACFVSSITARLTRLQIIAGGRDGEFAMLRQYLWHHKITNNLSMRIIRSAQQALFHYERNLSEKEVELFNVVSEPLKAEMHYEIYYGTISNHGFFRQFNKMNYHVSREICHLGIHTISVGDGDLLFSAGEVPRIFHMYFIATGVMGYKCEDKSMEVHEEMWACEAVLWTNWVHLGDMCAYQGVTVFALNADSLRQAVTKSQQDAYVAALYAKNFVEYLNEHWESVMDVNMDMEVQCWILEAVVQVDASAESELQEERRRTSRFQGKSVKALDFGERMSEPMFSSDSTKNETLNE